MSRLPVITYLLGLSLLLCSLLPTSASAAALTNVMVRVDSQTPSSALSGLICATPSTAGAGTEAQVAITFPTDFTISTSTANWTTDTADIPSASTPWPGIGTTASNVSGKTVTFASSDLTSDTDTYCFTFTAINSTTSSTTGNKTGTVTTRTSGASTIDSSIYAVQITNNHITIQGTVPAAPSDYTTTLEAFPEDLPIREDIGITYQLTYASNLAYPTNITLEAQWSLGTVQGAGVPTVEIANYVVGSATKAYNDAPAVIDTTNRKITWTISQLPGDSEPHTVLFKLKTTNTYTSKIPVTFTTSTRILGPGTATTPSSITHTYSYGAPSGRPTATPGPTATGTPTPTPIPPTVAISGIRIPTITATSAKVGISLTAAGSVSLRYGTNSREFSERIVSPSFQTSHLLNLEDLTPETPYYFRVQATSPQGKTVTSDIYTFTTAQTSTPVAITPQSLTVTSQKVILLSQNLAPKSSSLPTVVIPIDTQYEFQFALQDNRNITSITAHLEPFGEKGLGTIATSHVSLLETAQGVFTGRLTSPSQTGRYMLVTQIADASGNITQEQLTYLRVVLPFSISSQRTSDPVEHASVQLSQYNEKTRIYEPITTLPIPSPVFSTPTGIVPIILPLGKYEARITHPLFKEQTVRFTIGIYEGEDYPQVRLFESAFTVVSYIAYLAISFVDLLRTIRDFIFSLFSSSRVSDLMQIISFFIFFSLSLPFLLGRLQIPAWKMPKYLKNSFVIFLRHHTYIQIRIVNSKLGIPIRSAHVISDQYETYTNNKGYCLLSIPSTNTLTVTVKKHGYRPVTTTIKLSSKVHKFQIALDPDATYHPLLQAEKRFIISSFTGLIELVIVGCLVLSFIVGIEKAWPLLLTSIVNGLLLLQRYYQEAMLRRDESTFQAVG